MWEAGEGAAEEGEASGHCPLGTEAAGRQEGGEVWMDEEGATEEGVG